MLKTFAAALAATLFLAAPALAQEEGDRIDIGGIQWVLVKDGTLTTDGTPYLYAAGDITHRPDGITELYELDVFANVGGLIKIEVDCRTLDFAWRRLAAFTPDLVVQRVITDDGPLEAPKPDTETLRFLQRVCSGDKLPPEPDPLRPMRR